MGQGLRRFDPPLAPQRERQAFLPACPMWAGRKEEGWLKSRQVLKHQNWSQTLYYNKENITMLEVGVLIIPRIG